MYPQIIRIKDGRGKLVKDINIQLPKLLQDNDLLTYEGHLYIVISVSIEIQRKIFFFACVFSGFVLK